MNHVLKYGIVVLLVAAFLLIPIAVAAEAECSNETCSSDNLTLSEAVPTPTPAPPVGANHDLDYTNKYEPVVIDRGDGMGMLYVTVACHHTLISSTFTIQRVEQTGVDKLVYGIPLTEGNLKYLKFIGDNITRHLNPSGTFDERFVPQDLLVTLKDGNAGQPEYQLAKIAAGETSYVNFLGHAISSCYPAVQIVKATYGMIGEVCHQVVDVPAHTEYRYREALLCSNPLHKPWTQWSDTDNAPWWVPHCNKQTRQVEDTYKEECSLEGEYIDVTSAVQYVIDHGHSSFKFDNAQNPGGIFTPDGNPPPLYVITDPAPGQVKTVVITYNMGCGSGDQTLYAREYEVITLGTSIPPLPD